MIIDCHGHYTTEPKALQAFRKQQVEAAATPAPRPAKASLIIGDDEQEVTGLGAELRHEAARWPRGCRGAGSTRV